MTSMAVAWSGLPSMDNPMQPSPTAVVVKGPKARIDDVIHVLPSCRWRPASTPRPPSSLTGGPVSAAAEGSATGTTAATVEGATAVAKPTNNTARAVAAGHANQAANLVESLGQLSTQINHGTLADR